MPAVPATLAPIFQAAGKANGIPASVLAGIATVESGMGTNIGPSSTGAYGLMQFEPGTAASLGVNRSSPSSEIWGAAKLLNQYGYQHNPSRALGAYNGGPGNPQYSYAAKVIQASKGYTGQFAVPGRGDVPGAAPRIVAPQAASQEPTDPLQQRAPGMPSETRGQVLSNYLSATPSEFGGGTAGLAAAGSFAAPKLPADSVLSAQKGLQNLAGTETLSMHPDAGDGGAKVDAMIHAANSLVGKPYVWGGGHAGWGEQRGYDCSGFVSAVLHAAGYLQAPQTTQTLATQPGIDAGPGKFVTVYDRTDAPQGPSEDHVIIDVNGAWYESGGSAGKWGGGGGVQRIQAPPQQYLASFNRVLHPDGL
jgi:cell wall-associated NlpC family hydrolase